MTAATAHLATVTALVAFIVAILALVIQIRLDDRRRTRLEHRRHIRRTLVQTRVHYGNGALTPIPWLEHFRADEIESLNSGKRSAA